MANRTFVRLGALTGACAALRVVAAVRDAVCFLGVRRDGSFRPATNGSGYRSSAREREPGAAPSPPSRPPLLNISAPNFDLLHAVIL